MNKSSNHRSKQRVLLIGWDGADWQHINPLLDRGQLPNLERLINQGTMGNLATLKPVFSPMLWNTIATGKLPDQHGICGFMEPDPVNGGARPVTSVSRKVKAIWNILCQSGYRSNVVSWWASHPAEPINGNCVSQSLRFVTLEDGRRVLPQGTVHPASRSDELAELVVSPSEITVADVLPFIPHAAKIDQKKDDRLATFIRMLAECCTTQAIATHLMADDDWDFTAVYFDTIDHICHAFMPFQSPKMPQVSDEEFEIYRDVVDGIYRFQDMMLGVLWQMAGEDTLVVVCSDHGFESGGRRPMLISNEPAGPADWHRDLGMFAMAGPGIKKDERAYGANLIDITPTLLAYLGLPIGADMQGRPLLDAFEKPPLVTTIPSWETVDGDDGMHPAGTELEEKQSDELRKQFIALGYVEDHGDNLQKAYEAAQVEIDYNLARVFLSTGRPEQSKPILEDLLGRYPWEVRFITRLAHCYFACGYYRQCLHLLQKAFPAGERIPVMLHLLRAQSLLELGDDSEAMNELEQIQARNVELVHAQILLGRIYLSRNETKPALVAFQKAIELDADNALAYQGLANTHLKRRENEAAASAALDAVSRIHHLPQSHFVLGIALTRLGQYERAVQAFEAACHIHGNFAPGHRWLRRLFQNFIGDQEKAREHQRRLNELIQFNNANSTKSNARSTEVYDLPEIPDAATRRQRLLSERPIPKKNQKSGRELVLVSGLPRSGTSLMMQMLAAGGLPPMTDGDRVADIDNPEGYLEWAPIQSLQVNPSIMDEPELDHRATKVVSMLLSSLPTAHNYKIIFMMRPVEEIAVSQSKMIQRLGTEGSQQSTEELEQQFALHRQQVIQMLGKHENVELLLVGYHDLIECPGPIVEQLTQFVGSKRLPKPEQMATAIRPELYRQRV